MANGAALNSKLKHLDSECLGLGQKASVLRKDDPLCIYRLAGGHVTKMALHQSWTYSSRGHLAQ
jgi:hypothetical protein